MICIKKHSHVVKNLTENQSDGGFFSYKHYGLKLERRKKIGHS